MTTTREQLAERISGMLDGQTVLVGHGLRHDLQALQLDYWPVVDTAYVYGFAGLPMFTPGLAQLCTLVLTRELRVEGKAHNALDDAVAALDLMRHAAQPGAQLLLRASDTKVSLPFLLCCAVVAPAALSWPHELCTVSN